MSGNRGNRLRFSREEDDILIEVVSKNPCLYDVKHNYYHDYAFRDNIWEHIAQEINKSVSDCKVRWKSLKDVYRKRKKEILDGSNKRHCKWEHMDSLKFLEGVTSRSTTATPKPKKLATPDRPDFVNIQMLQHEANEETTAEESDIKIEMDEMDIEEAALESIAKEESDKDEMNGEATPSTSSHIEEPAQESSSSTATTSTAPRHPLQIFFDSMAHTAMSFPAPLAIRAKMEVLEVISKLELEMWNLSE